MKLIVISHPDHFTKENEVINCLFEMGMSHFHLRKPAWSANEISQLLKLIHPKFYERIVLHDHFQLAAEFSLGGIHFTRKTKDQMDQWSSFKGIQSTSCHSLHELEHLPAQIDYAFLSPVFSSISKPAYQAGFDRHELQQFMSTYNKTKVIALGGIDAENIPLCRQICFDGIAVLGDIWREGRSQQTIISRFLRLKKASYRLYQKTPNNVL
jgi:thiamine-phosphate pyrophosphorylase